MESKIKALLEYPVENKTQATLFLSHAQFYLNLILDPHSNNVSRLSVENKTRLTDRMTTIQDKYKTPH